MALRLAVKTTLVVVAATSTLFILYRHNESATPTPGNKLAFSVNHYPSPSLSLAALPTSSPPMYVSPPPPTPRRASPVLPLPPPRCDSSQKAAIMGNTTLSHTCLFKLPTTAHPTASAAKGAKVTGLEGGYLREYHKDRAFGVAAVLLVWTWVSLLVRGAATGIRSLDSVLPGGDRAISALARLLGFAQVTREESEELQWLKQRLRLVEATLARLQPNDSGSAEEVIAIDGLYFTTPFEQRRYSFDGPGEPHCDSPFEAESTLAWQENDV